MNKIKKIIGHLCLWTILTGSIECYATTLVVEGRSRLKGVSLRRIDEDAIENGFKKAIERVMANLTNREARLIRGALIDNRLKPYFSTLIKKFHVLSRANQGDERHVRLSVSIDVPFLRELLRKEGFFQGTDNSRALVLMSYQDEINSSNGSLYYWWQKGGGLRQNTWVGAKNLENEIENMFMSKGFLFIRGQELSLMDLMPAPLRGLKLQTKQLQDMGRLFEVQYIFYGNAHSWNPAAGQTSGQIYGTLELDLKLYSVEYEKIMGQSLQRLEVKGLTKEKALEDASSEIGRNIAKDLSRQIEDKWNFGHGKQPSVLVKISALNDPENYLKVYKLISEATDLVHTVVEYQQSTQEIVFLVELKVEIDKFINRLRRFQGQGLQFIRSQDSQISAMQPVVEMKWIL